MTKMFCDVCGIQTKSIHRLEESYQILDWTIVIREVCPKCLKRIETYERQVFDLNEAFREETMHRWMENYRVRNHNAD